MSYCREFNGVNEYMERTGAVTSIPIYFSIWVKHMGDFSRAHSIVCLGASGSDHRFLLISTTTGLWQAQKRGTQSGSTASTTCSSTSLIAPGVWTHVVAAFVSNTVTRIFVNGVQENETTSAANNIPASINRTRFAVRNVVGGALDDYGNIRISHYALYDEEITAGEINMLAQPGAIPWQVMPTKISSAYLFDGRTNDTDFDKRWSGSSIMGGSSPGRTVYDFPPGFRVVRRRQFAHPDATFKSAWVKNSNNIFLPGYAFGQ